MAFIFHMLIGFGKDKTHIDFGSLGNGQGHKCHFCKKWFPLIILRTIYYRAFIYQMLIGLGKDMTSIDLRFTR